MNRAKEKQYFNDPREATLKLIDGREIYLPFGLWLFARVYLVQKNGEKIPLPIGSYQLQHKKRIVITVPGVIASITELTGSTHPIIETKARKQLARQSFRQSIRNYEAKRNAAKD